MNKQDLENLKALKTYIEQQEPQGPEGNEVLYLSLTPQQTKALYFAIVGTIDVLEDSIEEDEPKVGSNEWWGGVAEDLK